MLGQIGLIHYISIGYLLLSLVLTMTRKNALRFLMIIPPICQVASVLLLKSKGFPMGLTLVLLLVNLVILFIFDMIEKKQMGLVSSEAISDGYDTEESVSASTETAASFSVDADLLSKPVRTTEKAEESTDFPLPAGAAPDLPSAEDQLLTRPEVENRPINEVGPSQEIFDASQSEVEEMIEQMVSSGDMANAKRYLRMLAFFAKDDETRTVAERKLAEINASGE